MQFRIINEIMNKLNSMKEDEKFLFVIDELGKMQSISKMYVEAIEKLLKTIEQNNYKKFVGVFVVPTNNSKWEGLEELKKKYKLLNINVDEREIQQKEFEKIILNYC